MAVGNSNVAEMSPTRGADLRDDIAETFAGLIAAESQLYSIATVGNDESAVVNLFAAGFFPGWIAFYNVTRLGFDEQYRTDNPKFATLTTKIEADIKRFRREKPTLNDVWDVIDAFDDYTPHVKTQKLIRINGS